MVRKEDNDIYSLLLELAKNVTRVADNKLSKKIKEVYKEEVEYMYDEFQPFDYRRRYDNGGFGDENNWDIDVNIKNNDVEIELINETNAVNSRIRLDKIIEDGIYDWKGLNPEARPIYQRVSDKIENEKVVENIIESELKKLGYKFK